MDKKQFKEWFREFNSKYKGAVPTDGWFDLVSEKHQSLQELIGGHTHRIEVNLDSDQNPAPYSEVEKEVLELINLIPHWFFQNKVKPGDLCYPVIREGPQEGMKWGRHIEFWRKKNAPEINKDQISKILGRLGERWAKCKTEKQKVHVTLSVHPAAFACLGHYAPDISLITGEASCWQQGKCSQGEKYKLSAHKNSFVLLVGKKEFPLDWSNLDVEARVWGVPTNDLQTFHLHNHYFKANVKTMAEKAMSIGNIHNAWKAYFHSLLKTPIESSEGLFSFTGVFKNKQGSVSYFPKGTLAKSCNLVFGYNGVAFVNPCHFCRRQADDMQDFDGRSVCVACLPRVPKCALTGERAFSLVYAYHPETEAMIQIKASLVNDPKNGWRGCELTGHFVKEDLMVRLTRNAGNYKVAKIAAESRNYKKCNGCGLYEILSDPYGHKVHEMCLKCRTEAALKEEKKNGDNNPTNKRTTYVKLKNSPRFDAALYDPAELDDNNPF